MLFDVTMQYHFHFGSSRYNISVAVRTGARNGLIYYAADGSQIDLLTLFLRDGQPVMVFNLGSGNLRLSPSDGRRRCRDISNRPKREMRPT